MHACAQNPCSVERRGGRPGLPTRWNKSSYGMMMSFEICSAFEICACREMRSESEAKGSGHESDCFTTSARTKPIAGMDDRAHPAELSARSVHPAGDMLALLRPPNASSRRSSLHNEPIRHPMR
jgi:hypothetical protein